MPTQMKLPNRLVRAAALGAAALVFATAMAAAALAAGGSASGATVKTRKTSLGTVLVDAGGKTLYMFTKDKGTTSSCSGACAANWPPVKVTGKPVAGAGVKASLLGTTKRSDGTMQVTYKRHPLYRFALDTKAGQTKGEGLNFFGGKWYALSAAGAKVMPATSTSGGGGGGYGGYGG